MGVYGRVKDKGIALPELARSVAAFVPWVQTGKLLFLSGNIAKKDGKPWAGKLGGQITVDEGIRAARASPLTRWACCMPLRETWRRFGGS